MKKASSRLLWKIAAIVLVFGSVLSAKATAYFWNVASPGANNWNVSGNWDVANFPGFGGSVTDVATFGATGTSANSTTVNNVVPVNTTIATLNFTNTTSGQWHVTQIPAGVTLTVNGATTVGFSVAVNGLVTSVAMNGGGTLALNGGLTIGNNGSSSGDQGTSLDLSGLTNFIFNAASSNITLSVGNRSSADLRLANGSNYITAANMNLNSASTSTGTSGTNYLGLGTNNINVGAISMAAARNNSVMVFPGATGGLRLRGVTGTDVDRASLLLANRNQNTSGGNNTGLLSFNGHPVDVKFSTVTMGQAQASTPTGTNIGTGIINFDYGTIDATTILMAISGVNVTNTANATINVGTNVALATSGNLVVGSGGISLANQGLSAATGGSTGNLNISGGSVICAGPIFKTTAAGIGNINITNGTLTVSSTVGTLAIPLTTLNTTNGTITTPASFATTNIVVGTLNAIAGTSNTINISSLPVIPAFPSQLSVIKYTTGSGDLTTFALGTLPGTFQGYISNNVTTSSVDLVITNGPTPPPAAKAITWDGEVSGDWDTTTTNWVTGGGLTNYNNVTLSNTGDNVTFDDTLLGTTNVNLTQALSPTTLTVNNNASNYVLTGTGRLTGATVVTKSGSGSLLVANSGANDFTGGITINAGTVQFGNGTTAGSVPASVAITDNSALVIDHSDSFTNSSAISGSGSVTQAGAGTLTLGGVSGFTGGLTVNQGAVRATAVSAAGTGLVTVNSGATFVVGAALTNSFAVSNATIGASVNFTNNMNKEFTAAANSTNIIYSADPQNPTTSFQFLIDNNLRGSGTIVVINALVQNIDGGQGVRFRNTNAMSDFSGTIIYTNGNKGELLTTAPDNATYSPIGTGKLVLYCGNYLGTNGTLAVADGTGYTELNLRNSGGAITIGNDITLMGTGAAIINSLSGSNGITMGKLTMSANQELIGYKASTSPAVTNVVIFPTASIGGNVTFSPHSTSFGAANQFGTDFSLGPITESVGGSSITKGGLGALSFTGVNNYSGNTTITNGILFLKGSASIANSPNIILGSGGVLDVTNLVSTFTLGASQTLSNITSTAALSGNVDASLGAISLRYASGVPSMTVSNGALTVASGTAFKVNNTGAALVKGTYKLISAANGGSVAGTAPSSVSVGGNGVTGTGASTLQITGNELYLVTPNTAPTITHIVTNAVAAGLTWKIPVSTLKTAAGWADVDGDTLTITAAGPTSNLGKSVTEDGSFVYYNAPVTGEDFFSYTISDGTATANGTVYLESSGSPTAPANATLLVPGGDGVPTITFAGIPGRTNVVEASTNLVNWNPISTNVAGTNGLWQVIDNDATNFLNRYYRSYQVYP